MVGPQAASKADAEFSPSDVLLIVLFFLGLGLDLRCTASALGGWHGVWCQSSSAAWSAVCDVALVACSLRPFYATGDVSGA